MEPSTYLLKKGTVLYRGDTPFYLDNKNKPEASLSLEKKPTFFASDPDDVAQYGIIYGWVVSDDIEEAKLRFRDLDTDLNLIYFDQSGLTDLEVWDLMREFGGYIISNSSFSWWAAFLRRNHESLVCAPSPWFQGMNNPELLIPEDWIKVNSL